MSFNWAFHVARMMKSVGDSDLPLHAIAALSDLVSFDHTGLFAFRRHQRPRDILASRYDSTFHRTYCARSHLLDPFYKHAHDCREGGVFRMGELDRDYVRYLDGYEMGPLVGDILGAGHGPNGRYGASHHLAEEIGYLLPIQDGFVVHVAMIRSTEAGSFHDDEIGKLKAFAPVVHAAFSSHFRSINGGRPFVGESSANLDPDAQTAWIDQRLTPREQSVMRLVAAGLSSVQMALHLGIAVETVKVHRKNAYRKLGISTRAELWALQRSWCA